MAAGNRDEDVDKELAARLDRIRANDRTTNRSVEDVEDSHDARHGAYPLPHASRIPGTARLTPMPDPQGQQHATMRARAMQMLLDEMRRNRSRR